MGASYLGGYIGYDESKVDWLKNRTDKWDRNIRVVTKTASKYPQESYTAMYHAILPEWIFLHCVIKDTGRSFEGF